MFRAAILIRTTLFTGFLFSLFSQSFSWQADTTMKYGTPDSTILFRTYLMNTTVNQESLRVFRTNYNFPGGWSSSFCMGGISGVCYAPFFDTIPDPVVLNASEIVELAIDVQTSATPDQCNFTIQIENWSNPSDFLTKAFTASTLPNSIRNNQSQLAYDFYLYDNYPNPFNPETTIRYLINKNIAQPVRLVIYNNIGQLVRTLINDIQTSGSYRVIWNGRDTEGHPSPTGIYYYQLQVGSQQITHKMILIK